MPAGRNGIDADIRIAGAFEPSDISLKGMRNSMLMRLLAVSVFPLVALALYFRFQYTSTLEERSELQLETIASNHAASIDRFINNRMMALKSIVQGGLINLPPSGEEIKKLHLVLRTIDDTILDVGVFDADGNHIRYSGPFEFLEGKNYRNEHWFRTISSSESPVFASDMFLGYREQAHFAVVVRTIRGNRPWFLRMTINPAAFLDLVDNVSQIKGAHAFIVNLQGIFQSVPEEIGSPLDPCPEIDLLKNHKQVREIEVGGRSYLTAVHRLKSVNWILVIRQPSEIAYEPIEKTERVIIFIIIAGIVIILAVSVYATRTLIRKYARSEKSRADLIGQLVQAGKLSTMGEMAAGVAHEINNPLAIILSETGLMEDFLNPQLGGDFNREEFLTRLKSIKEETNRCRDIIHKLLGFARRTSSTISECSLNDIVTETVDLIRQELNLENIIIQTNLEKTLSPIMTDPAQIKQVLLNLLRNAADAIGKDGNINVTTKSGGQTASLILSDTGCGIPEENLQKLFLPFFTTKEVGEGTGLGLSIAHGIVTSLGGRISVHSIPGSGTTFEIILPVNFHKGSEKN